MSHKQESALFSRVYIFFLLELISQVRKNDKRETKWVDVKFFKAFFER